MEYHRGPVGRILLAVALICGLGTCAEQDQPDAPAAEAGPSTGFAAVDMERAAAAAAEPGQWFTTGRDLGETHYSPLARITRENVGELGFAWEYATGTTRGLEATPVVVDGIMYTSGTWGKVYALDARTGAEIWSFDPGVDGQVARDACCDIVNRGVAVWRGKVYVGALDGRLIALDAENGDIEWQVDTITEHSRRYTITGAPRIAGEIVVIGNSGAEFDARGYISAYDTETGEFRWRFFTVPGSPEKPYEHPELEMAAQTWDPESLWEVGGGGTVWDGMAYDPELNLLYVGTGNAAPYAIVARSPSGGDNLFLSSILAIDADSGRLVWHYQTTPGDSWDFTATQNLILADIEFAGAPRKVIMQAPKNGFFYVIDRATGELLSAEPYVPVNWASHIDTETGKPVMTPAADYFAEPKVQWPTDAGGHGWRPMAYSPDTGLVYIPAWEMAWLRVNQYPEGYKFEPGRFNMGVLNFSPEDAVIDLFAPILPYEADYMKSIVAASDIPPTRDVLRAWNPITQSVAWEVDNIAPEDGGGLLATAGGLVFQGRSKGLLAAYNAITGELLAEIETGSSIMAAPASYEVDGEQYIAVMAGLGGAANWVIPEYSAAYHRGNAGRIIAFKLGGGSVPIPPRLEPTPIPEPPPRINDADLIAKGNELYIHYCYFCHQNGDRNLLPDPRKLGKERHEFFEDIVMRGALRPNGMAQFDDHLSAEEFEAIRAYVIEISWAAYAAEQGAAEGGD